MSLILDALKKLDREKIERIEEKVDVTAGILKAGDSAQHRSFLPPVLALAITASLAAFATYLIFSGSGLRTGEPRSAVPAASVAQLQNQQATVAPVPPAPAAVTDRPPVTPSAPPAAPPLEVSEAMPLGKTKKIAEPAAKGRVPQTPRKAAAAPEEQSGSLPTLKISGIVWQDSSSDRKVVINGRVAREGDMVEGVKVLEIYPTFVNVSFKGRSYKVKMFD
jgi:type IV secretory pathway VirB10-like protein